MKSKSTAALLALFLGGLGIHRFYLGQVGLGFVYMLLCWTFVPSMIAFIDMIAFFAMNEDKFNTIYNNTTFIK